MNSNYNENINLDDLFNDVDDYCGEGDIEVRTTVNFNENNWDNFTNAGDDDWS